MTADGGREESPVLLVGGTPRSGTSLMRRLLASHPDVVLPPFELGLHRHVHAGRSPTEAAAEVLDQLDSRLGTVDRSLIDATSFGALFRSLLRAMSDVAGRPIAGDKTPGIETALDAYRDWLPGRRVLFVQLVRHPADVVASHLRAPWYDRGDDPVAVQRAASRWCRSAAVALDGSGEVDVHEVVRFEDVTFDPRTTAATLCATLGLRSEPTVIETMLAGETSPHAVNSSFDEIGERVAGAVHRGLERRDHLTASQREIVATTCGELADRLGYRMTA